MSEIRNTITSALSNAGVSEYQQENYSRYITAVEEAFVEKGYEMVESLVAAGKAQGLGMYGREEELVSIIEQATGLTRRPAPEPEPVVEAPSASDLEALFGEDEVEEGGKKKGKKAKLNAILEQLQGIASKQAEQDDALNKLKGLAQSRLGVTL